MKKALNIFLSIAALSMMANVALADTTTTTPGISKRPYLANVQSKRLAAGTTIKLQLLDPASTAEANAGDMFQGMLVEDKIDNGTMILPKGTIFRGAISRIVPSKRLSRGAILYLTLDHVVTPTGRQVPLKAGLLSNGLVLTTDGGIKAGGNYGYALKQNWQTATNIMGNCLDWGIEMGDKALGNWTKFITIPVGAVGGTIGSFGYYAGAAVGDLFKKGGDVILHQGSTIDFILMDSIDVPVQ